MNIKELFLMQKQSEHEGTMSVYGKISLIDWTGVRPRAC